MIPTIDLVTLSDIWTTTIQVRLVYHNLRKIMVNNCCLVCLISTASGRSKKCLGTCGACSRDITKLEQSIFFRYLCSKDSKFMLIFLGAVVVELFEIL